MVKDHERKSLSQEINLKPVEMGSLISTDKLLGR
jgi:hypothetical protein